MNWNWIKVQQKQVSWHKWLKILLIHINSSFLYWSSSAISHTHAQAVFLCTLTFTEQASYFPSFSQSQHCSGQRFWSRGVLEMLLLTLVCKIKVTSFVSLIVALQGNFISAQARILCNSCLCYDVPEKRSTRVTIIANTRTPQDAQWVLNPSLNIQSLFTKYHTVAL